MKTCIVPGCMDKQHQYGLCESHRASATVGAFKSTPIHGKKIDAADVYVSEATLLDGYRETHH